MSKEVANTAIIFIAVVFLAVVLKTLKSFLLPFTIALLFTVLLIPLIQMGRKKPLLAGTILVGVVGGFVILVYALALMVGAQSAKITDDLPQYENTVEASMLSINDLIPGTDLKLEQFVSAERIGGYLKSVFQVFTNFFSIMFLAVLFTIFTAASYSAFLKKVERHLTMHKKKQLHMVIIETEKSIRSYLFVKTLISLATATVSASILYIFNSEFYVLMGLLIFILNYIPNIGSLFATLIAILIFGLTNGFGGMTFFLAVFLIATQVLFGNFIEPKLSGEKLKLSPVLILLSLFFWYWVWGMWGMFLAVPLTAIIKIILEHQKNTSKVVEFLS